MYITAENTTGVDSAGFFIDGEFAWSVLVLVVTVLPYSGVKMPGPQARTQRAPHTA